MGQTKLLTQEMVKYCQETRLHNKYISQQTHSVFHYAMPTLTQCYATPSFKDDMQ